MVVERSKKLKTLYMTKEGMDTMVVGKYNIDPKLQHQKFMHMNKKKNKITIIKRTTI